MNIQVRKPTQRGRRRQGKQPGDGAAEPQRAVTRPAGGNTQARAVDHEVKVAMAAYFIAEKRGFEPGHELDDWLAAEAQIAAAETPSVTKPIQPVQQESLS